MYRDAVDGVGNHAGVGARVAQVALYGIVPIHFCDANSHDAINSGKTLGQFPLGSAGIVQ